MANLTAQTTTFKAFSTVPNEDIITGKPKTKTFAAWSDLPNDVDTIAESVISTFYTKSSAVGKLTVESNYFWNIYDTDPNTNSSAEPQFSVAFGTTSSNFTISSNSAYTGSVEDVYTYPPYAIYRQMINAVTDGGSYSNWAYTNEAGSTISPGNVYIISFARSRIKDYIEPATTLGSSSLQVNLSGSNLVYVKCAAATSLYQTAYNVVTGTGSLYSGTNAVGNTLNSVVGRFYSDKGIIVLDADKLYSSGAFASSPTVAAAAVYTPSASLYNIYSSLVKGVYFKARSVEKVQSTHYFVRAKNYEFNYSNNPTWVSGSDNEVLQEFYDEQKTFITSVGLYDGDPTVEGSGQLVAIAKLSKPILKTPDTEILLKVRLDY